MLNDGMGLADMGFVDANRSESVAKMIEELKASQVEDAAAFGVPVELVEAVDAFLIAVLFG